MSIILTASNISKQYRLGLVGTGTLNHDLKRWWFRIRGKEDPFLKVGAVNDRSAKATENYVWALKNINFEVEKGEVLGIIGKNGAGKSTLLKILSRVTTPSTGEIKTKGRIASLLEVGTGFHPELTGRENIFLNGAILGMTKAEISSKLEEIISFSGCEMFIDTPVKRYSSGMRVRLAFAVAAHLEPDILVIDEVLAVGDAEFQKKAIGKMQDISKTDGRTVLFVSHNMAAVKSLCTRAFVIDNGSITFKGNTDDAVDYYLINNRNEEHVNLNNREDRRGGKDFRFSDISIKDQKGVEQTNLLSGEHYTFDVRFSLKYAKDNIAIRLKFIDNQGVMRFLCNNAFTDTLYSLKETKQGNVSCVIPKLPLPNGEYSIQLTCLTSGGILDDIENVLIFNVVGGDFFGTGKEQVSKQGVLVENSFLMVNQFKE